MVIKLTSFNLGRVAGILYLLIIATGLFSEGYVRAELFSFNQLASFADGLKNNETLFRAGVLSDFFAFLMVIGLTVTLYLITRKTTPSLALAGFAFRIAEGIVLILVTLLGFTSILIVTSSQFSTAFDVNQVGAVSLLFKSIHSVGYDFGIMLSAVGVSIYALAFLRAKLVPSSISIFYIFAAFQMFLCTIILLLFPGANATLYPMYLLPILIAELMIGLWLTLFGIPPSATEQSTDDALQ